MYIYGSRYSSQMTTNICNQWTPVSLIQKIFIEPMLSDGNYSSIEKTKVNKTEITLQRTITHITVLISSSFSICFSFLLCMHTTQKILTFAGKQLQMTKHCNLRIQSLIQKVFIKYSHGPGVMLGVRDKTINQKKKWSLFTHGHLKCVEL